MDTKAHLSLGDKTNLEVMFSSSSKATMIWIGVIVHGLAIGSMLFWLQNGLFFGNILERIQFITNHVFLWQVGWGLWAMASFSLILMMLAWADSLPHKGWGALAVLLCAIGSLVDWVNDAILIAFIPRLALSALSEPLALELFQWWEYLYPVLSAGVAVGLYGVAGLILNLISWQTPHFPRWLTWLGFLAWLFSFGMSYAGFTHSIVGMYVMSAATFTVLLPFFMLLSYKWVSITHE